MSKRIVIFGYEYHSGVENGIDHAASWQHVIDHAAEVEYVVVNLNSGPGLDFDAVWAALFKRLRAAGIKLLAYVHVSYGERRFEEVRRDAVKWDLYYGVDGRMEGFFFDEAPSDGGPVSLEYCRKLRLLVPAGVLVLNHGTIPDQQYSSLANIMCVAETSQAKYQNIVFPQWMHERGAQRFLNILYDVASPTYAMTMIDQNFPVNSGQASLVYLTSLASLPDGNGPSYDVDHTLFPASVSDPQPQAPTLAGCTDEQLLGEVARRIRH